MQALRGWDDGELSPRRERPFDEHGGLGWLSGVKSGVVGVARRAGILLVRDRRVSANGYRYQTVVLRHPLAPWLEPEFATLYEAVRAHTLVDAQRCYELWDLACQAQRVEGDFLEVGCWRGGSGCVIASAARSRITYLCDTFAGVVKTGTRDGLYRGGEHADTSPAIVTNLARKLDLANVRVVPGIFPDDHRSDFSDKHFAFVHLDVDAYLSTKDALEFVWPRLPTGGVVVFDDYGMITTNGVTALIDEARSRDRLVIYNLNGHAVMVKL
jgi:O-methyltransferase